MSIPYLITFKPTGRFFFGTSQSFGEGFNPISSQFPTQTTLLGAIRAKILEQNNCLDLEKKKPIGDYEKHTGTSPMRGLDETNDNFGKIEKLSPVFLVKWKSSDTCPSDFLIPAPADVFFEYDENKKNDEGDPLVKSLLRFELEKVDKLVEGGASTYTFTKRIKEDQAAYLGGINFWESYKQKQTLPFDKHYLTKNIFISDSQPGIARETDGIKRRTAKDEHFYRKLDYRLNSDFCFGLVVHFTEENVLKEDHVFLGGERSLFIMKLNKLPLNPSHVFSDHPIVKRFYDKNDVGDYNGESDSKAGAGDYLVVSPFFAGAETVPKEVKIQTDFALINYLYAPRSINNVEHKTDSFRAIPVGSILKTESNIKAIQTYKTTTIIGHNFTIKF